MIAQPAPTLFLLKELHRLAASGQLNELCREVLPCRAGVPLRPDGLRHRAQVVDYNERRIWVYQHSMETAYRQVPKTSGRSTPKLPTPGLHLSLKAILGSTPA